MNRILVIRGGAIGDFILTLPALRALREAHPNAHVEVLGYRQIVALADNRFYAQAVRSIEYGPLSGFFARAAELPEELSSYFAGFDLIISYLYDPDDIFEANLRRCGVRKFVRGPARVADGGHAAQQLAAPVRELGIESVDLSAKVFPSAQDEEFARTFVRDLPRPILAIHPGSGSERKNWPVENWIRLGNEWIGAAAPVLEEDRSRCKEPRGSLIVVLGEADEVSRTQLEQEWRGRENVRFAKNLPLPQLAAVLKHSIFAGHDSGISHLAAAAGASCVLLFGPTNSDVWAPRNETVRVIRAGSGVVKEIDLGQVREALISFAEISGGIDS
jgi:ADP-heptose:LPS heptosyltransferase